MLTNQLTNTVLYTYPKLPTLMGVEKNRITRLLSFEFNSEGVCADVLFDMIFLAEQKFQALSCLKNMVSTALSHLTVQEREFVELFYFKRLSYEAISRKMKLSISTLSLRRNSALEKLSSTLEILGCTEGFILKNFDEQKAFIASAEFNANRKVG